MAYAAVADIVLKEAAVTVPDAGVVSGGVISVVANCSSGEDVVNITQSASLSLVERSFVLLMLWMLLVMLQLMYLVLLLRVKLVK